MARQYADYALVIKLAPELAPVDQALVECYLECLEDCVGLDFYEDVSDKYHAFLTAHVVSLLPTGGPGGGGAQPGGQITSIADGPASVGFSAPDLSSLDGELARTAYGIMCERINAGRRHKSSIVLARTDC